MHGPCFGIPSVMSTLHHGQQSAISNQSKFNDRCGWHARIPETRDAEIGGVGHDRRSCEGSASDFADYEGQIVQIADRTMEEWRMG